MVRLRSRIAISQRDEKRLAVQSNIARRILFGAIGLLLLLSFVLSVDWQEDFEDGMIAGTIFYFAVTAVCLAVAGWNSVLLLDRADGRAHFMRKLFGIRLTHATLELSRVKAIVIQSIRFLRESEQPRTGFFSGRLRQQVERRNVYHKLYLEGEEKLHFVEDSTDAADLEAAGKTMADFLGISYRHDEL